MWYAHKKKTGKQAETTGQQAFNVRKMVDKNETGKGFGLFDVINTHTL